MVTYYSMAVTVSGILHSINIHAGLVARIKW